MKSSAQPSPAPPYGAATVPGVDHYENFPVGSMLLPRVLRPAVFAIYHFARHADDIADEGDAPLEARVRALRDLHDQLDHAEEIAAGKPVAAADATARPLDAVVSRLIEPVRQHHLGWIHCHALLDAFEQDLTVSRYPDRAAVDHYCARSANPVGRLMLELFAVATPANLQASDAICSALQRINFLQDIAIDMAKDRIYMPLATLTAAGLDAAEWQTQIAAGRLDVRAREVVRRECAYARAQLLAGRPLLARVPRRLRWELRAILCGGLRVLERIAAARHDPVAARPRLGWADAPAFLRLALALDRIAAPAEPAFLDPTGAGPADGTQP